MNRTVLEALDLSRRLDARIEGLGLPASSELYRRLKTRSWRVYGLIGAGEFRRAVAEARYGLSVIEGASQPTPLSPFGRLIKWLSGRGR